MAKTLTKQYNEFNTSRLVNRVAITAKNDVQCPT